MWQLLLREKVFFPRAIGRRQISMRHLRFNLATFLQLQFLPTARRRYSAVQLPQFFCGSCSGTNPHRDRRKIKWKPTDESPLMAFHCLKTNRPYRCGEIHRNKRNVVVMKFHRLFSLSAFSLVFTLSGLFLSLIHI